MWGQRGARTELQAVQALTSLSHLIGEHGPLTGPVGNFETKNDALHTKLDASDKYADGRIEGTLLGWQPSRGVKWNKNALKYPICAGAAFSLSLGGVATGSGRVVMPEISSRHEAVRPSVVFTVRQHIVSSCQFSGLFGKGIF